MIVTLVMPRLGETMEEGTVSRWLVENGARFERGAALIEFETDKTAVEYPALGPGRLVEQLAAPGDLVELGAPLARIDLEGAPDWISPAPPPEDRTSPRHKAPAAAVRDAAPPRPEGAPGPLRATPLARRAAQQAGINLATIRGTGRRGRIELTDVTAARHGGTALAASDWGPGTGPRVLLIHGFAGDRSGFEQLGRGLARAGLHVRAIDLPGHGETRAEARGFDDLVAGVLAELAGVTGAAHLVGHSLGAAVAVKVAAAREVASLTLITPAGLGHGIDSAFVHGLARAGSRGALGHLLRRLSPRADAFSPEITARIHADLSRGRLHTLAEEIAPGDGAARGQAIDIVPDLTALATRIPVRILIGHRDRILDWADGTTISAAIPVHHFPEAGHMPHWDAPAEVEAIIAKGILHGE